ncbi:O-antigen ligase family protein [Luteolibacter sp. AS25]|uniref:O-antigen ligase family protein n=1 Tax=Luteolibacter sp. AS25 TaxID=3135776 RepID=UPI00398B4B9F
MLIAASIFWVLGFILSVTIAPQLRLWTWGPTMLCFTLAGCLVIPATWKKSLGGTNLYILITGTALAFWIAVRALTSPVVESAISDALLLSMAVSTFVVFRSATLNPVAEKIFLGGIIAILAATVGVIAIQVVDPSYSPIFPSPEIMFPRGFHGHYSYCASFLIPASLLLASQGISNRYHWAVRILLLTCGILGIGSLFFMMSRGGLVGAGFGVLTLALGWILIGYRDQKKWFFPVAISAPIVLLGITVFFMFSLGNVQENRGGGGIGNMLDNSIRLYLLSIAVSCIQTHALFGGGSRSFSWECFQHWDVKAFGGGGVKPEHVHNELIQTLTDYGIIGGVLLVAFILAAVMVAIGRILSNPRTGNSNSADAWRIGGLAGFIGLFVHSNFEGIFRIPPGAILLGLCFAAMTIGKRNSKKSLETIFPLRSGLTTLVTLCAVAAMGFFGYKSSASLPHLWPVYFSEIPKGNEAKVEALSKGIAQFPLQTLILDRALIYRDLSRTTEDFVYRDHLAQLCLLDFLESSRLHPYDPYSLLNAAKALQKDGQKQKADTYFLKAVEAQGGMEFAFAANQGYAKFLLEEALAAYDLHKPIETINQLQIAAKYIEKSSDLTAGAMTGNEGRELLGVINLSLGQAYEAAGQFEESLDQYDFTANLAGGASASYLGALLLGKQAVSAWYDRRQSDALRLFMEAEKRLSQNENLPPGVEITTRNRYREYLGEQIKFLTETNVIPANDIHF